MLGEWTLKVRVNFMTGKVPSKGTKTSAVAVLAQPNVSKHVGKHQKRSHNFLTRLTAKTAALPTVLCWKCVLVDGSTYCGHGDRKTRLKVLQSLSFLCRTLKKFLNVWKTLSCPETAPPRVAVPSEDTLASHEVHSYLKRRIMCILYPKLEKCTLKSAFF